MSGVIQVLTTVPSSVDAERLATELLQVRLAACVQILGPCQSRFWWEGKIDTATEWLCLIKTREELYPEVQRAIQAAHPYEVPEIMALPVLQGLPAYLLWLNQAASGPGT